VLRHEPDKEKASAQRVRRRERHQPDEWPDGTSIDLTCRLEERIALGDLAVCVDDPLRGTSGSTRIDELSEVVSGAWYRLT